MIIQPAGLATTGSAAQYSPPSLRMQPSPPIPGRSTSFAPFFAAGSASDRTARIRRPTSSRLSVHQQLPVPLPRRPHPSLHLSQPTVPYGARPPLPRPAQPARHSVSALSTRPATTTDMYVHNQEDIHAIEQCTQRPRLETHRRGAGGQRPPLGGSRPIITIAA